MTLRSALGFLTKESNVPFFRKIVLKGGVVFMRLVSGIKLSDSQNGFRALSREAAQKITIQQDGMAHASEILDKIKRYELRYQEVPVTIRYTGYSIDHGQSSRNMFHIARRLILQKLFSK